MKRKTVTLEEYYEIPKVMSGRCFIIGGGVSLSVFPFEVLKGKQTIGCNDAYIMGTEICNYCCFGDIAWHDIHMDGKKDDSYYRSFGKYRDSHISILTDFQSDVITNTEKLDHHDNVHVCKRTTCFISPDNYKLGWFTNTGAMAIELAVKMGAAEIILLGFDMKLTDGKNNFHVNLKDVPDANLFPKFKYNFMGFARILRKKFPEVRVINGNPDSELEDFEKIHWKELI